MFLTHSPWTELSFWGRQAIALNIFMGTGASWGLDFLFFHVEDVDEGSFNCGELVAQNALGIWEGRVAWYFLL